MTTVAVRRYSDGVVHIAADRLATWDGQDLEKAKLLGNSGHLWAAAGDVPKCGAFEHWMNTGMNPVEYPSDMDDFGALVVEKETGRAFLYNDRPFPLELIGEGSWADGSGGQFAKAFMVIGYSPQEAIELIITHRLDKYTGISVDNEQCSGALSPGG